MMTIAEPTVTRTKRVTLALLERMDEGENQ
jgi:hypothetical protein